LPHYEIRVAHQLDEELAAAFEGLDVMADGPTTVMRGDLDQAALHGMLERVRMLHLELVEARRVPGLTDPKRDVKSSPAAGDPGRGRVWDSGRDRTGCKGVAVGTRTYEIRVVGALGPAGRKAFSDVSIAVEPSVTVLTADVAQSGLHALLDRVRDLGLELIDIKQTPRSSRP
jgi:hypothetical protein